VVYSVLFKGANAWKIRPKGLHLSDLPVLVKVLKKIVDKNNTVLIADNREELLCNCDQVIKLE